MNGQIDFLLVGNGSYLNRGCEAIVRGTAKILRNAFRNCRFVNANFDVTDPPFAPTESDPDVVHRPLSPVRRMTARWAATKAAERLCPPLEHYLRFGALEQTVSDSTAVLSIGGDNYTLDYGVPRMYVSLDRFVLAHQRPLIIWGASIGPFDDRPGFARTIHGHLRQEVTALFVREERTRSYLAGHGITQNVHLMPDPAFVMDPEPVEEADLGFSLPEEAIGVNLSPLMAQHVAQGDDGAWEKIGIEIVRELIETHRRPILLIPHVTSPHSDDHAFLGRIKARLPDDLVTLLPRTLSAAQTKYAISKLCCLIAARTHATIASFSTCVPTVSLAYSRKAWGINEMLFGHTAYVVAPAQVTASTVAEAVGRVLEESHAIRGCLSEKMAALTRDAMAAGEELKRVIACN